MGTSLRVRLVAALMGLVLALAGLGGWSAWHLWEMGEVAQRILADNYLSVDAAQQMRESLERIDADRRLALAGQAAGVATDLADQRARFDAALQVAAGNLTEPGEGAVVEQIRTGFARYLAGGPAGSEVSLVRANTARLLEMNQEAMHRKSDGAGAVARRNVLWGVGLALALTLGGVVVTRAVATSVVGPIEVMTRATTRIAGGDLDVAVPAERDDELGQMARSFNDMTARLRESRASDRGALAQARQVAERVMLLEDVRHLHEVNRLKSEFVAEASHELRTPLASLQLGVNLLLERPDALNPRQLEILTLCRDDGERLARLSRDLLDLSRLETGQRAPHPVPVATAGLVDAAVTPLRRQVEVRGLTLQVDLPPELPAVSADRAQIERVLSNLVANAIRATPAGGRIAVSAASRPDAVAVTVTDTGVGVPPEYLSRVFEPFVQVPDGPRGGAGLGLAICRRIVEAHGGQISVQSTPGLGSAFTFTLPRAVAVREESHDASSDRR
jgi:signal transduction histidine kinase